MLPPSLLRFRRPLILALHAVLVVMSLAAAMTIRYEGVFPTGAFEVFMEAAGALVAIRLVSFAVFGLHRGFWKHFGLPDLIALLKAVVAGSVAFWGVLLLFDALGPVPRFVVLIEGMITFLFVGGARLAVRSMLEGRLTARATPRKRALVVGAGEAAERLLRQLSHENGGGVQVVALLDDDLGKRGRSLHGVPIVGSVDRLEEMVVERRAELVVIAISRATPEEIRCIVERCLRVKVDFKRLPSMREMLEGSATPGVLKNVELEHLLVREPVRLDEERVAANFGGGVVLVTGGAGSVGSELARQIARARPERLVLVDQAESPLYFAHLELQRTYPALEVAPLIADITDRRAMENIFERYRPDFVFHAAAYKHVPLMEANVRQAVVNNVMGTLLVSECAVRWGVQKMVLISTDKAVRPSSVMGATKRVAERIVLGWPTLRASGTEFYAVRFGNVLGSDGSVVPLFRRQLAAGGPLTVTHRDARRYFMTITEAAQLVLHAATLADAAGRITMLDMGEPIRILDLAENLVRLSGLEPYRDVEIVFTGLRPGEKLDEELMSDVERCVPTGMEKVSVVQTDEVDGATVQQGVGRLLAAVNSDDVNAALRTLQELVPECVAPLRGMAVALTPSAPTRRERAPRVQNRAAAAPA
ncbi:MAG TPA: nucleoside-diphosphate sugar epimerase/dehydratase [Gemmatimonadaceae bacterium]|nr:nucleoside-diphosphate sugar epimerase/dehydratase [Gemmatimonadaceae bacterium]